MNYGIEAHRRRRKRDSETEREFERERDRERARGERDRLLGINSQMEAKNATSSQHTHTKLRECLNS